MSELARAEPPEVMARNLRVAAQLWASATGFFFIAFLFAYFYLRSLDQNGLWHPKGVDAPFGLGTIFISCVAASAALAAVGAQRLRAGDGRAWRRLGLLSLVLGVAAVVLQIVEWTRLDFGPTNGGFASVFVGWTGLYLVFVVGSLFWVETMVATSYRNRDGVDVSSGADACSFYLTSVAAIGVATWVVLYML